MAEDSLITEEVRGKIGVEGEPKVYEIEKGLIKRFAKAIDDPNPLWQDEEHARKSKYGGIIAPPALIIALGWEDFDAERPHGEAGLHGGTELEYYQPVRAGDTITITSKLVDVRERESKRLGKMLLSTYERTCKNQRQEIVAKCQQTFISYKVMGVKHD